MKVERVSNMLMLQDKLGTGCGKVQEKIAKEMVADVQGERTKVLMV